MFPFFESNNIKFSCFHSSPPTYPVHFHKEVEFFYILNGDTEVKINQVSTLMHSGDFAVIFPGQLHEYIAVSEQNTALLVLFQPELIPNYTFLFQNYEPLSAIVPSHKCHPDISFSMTQLWDEVLMSTPNQQVYPAYVQLLLARLTPELEICQKKEPPYENYIYRIIEYLSENYMQPLTLSDVAYTFGISKSHLSRIFSQQIHISFRDYLNNLRVNEAQTRLRTTSFSITDIAYQCGFESPRSFNRNFSRITGMSPRNYRHSQL